MVSELVGTRAKKALRWLAEGASIAVIVAILGWGWHQVASVTVDGSRESCQKEFPGRECMIVWVPKP